MSCSQATYTPVSSKSMRQKKRGKRITAFAPLLNLNLNYEKLRREDTENYRKQKFFLKKNVKM